MNFVKKIATSAAIAAIASATFVTPAFAESATIKWNGVQGAKWYNVYYKVEGKNKWQHSVSGLNEWSRGLKIRGLSDEVEYVYQVRAVNAQGAEFKTVKKGDLDKDN